MLEYASLRFGKYGVAGTTIDELAKDMRMGKASLYHYFTSKEDLYYQAITFESGRLLAKIKDIFNEDTTSLNEKLRMYFGLKTELKNKHRIVYNLFNLVINETATAREKELTVEILNKEASLLKAILSITFPDDTAIEDRELGLFLNLLSLTALYSPELLNLYPNDKKKELFSANFLTLIEKFLDRK